MKRSILLITLIILCVTTNQAQEKTKESKIELNAEKISVKLKGDSEVTVFIDGKKYDQDILELINVDKIESMNVLKGKKAMDEYNVDKVILIKTKKANDKIEVANEGVKITMRDLNLDGNDESKYPKIIIDGVTSTPQQLKNLSPNDINSITVLKDKKSRKEHNAENGVIKITTKKKKK